MNQRDLIICKIFIVICNIVNIGIGLYVAATCILYMREQKVNPKPRTPLSFGLLAFIITMTLFLIVTAVLGCVAALKKHHRALYVQACFYAFLVSVEAIWVIGVGLVSSWGAGNDDLRLNFFQNGTTNYNMAWDRLQIEYRCCGVDGPHDYAIVHRDIPASCCASANPLREGGAKRQLHTNCVRERTYYMRGCDNAVDAEMSSHEKDMFLTIAVVFAMEITVFIFSLSMMKHIRKQRRQLQQNLQAHFES